MSTTLSPAQNPNQQITQTSKLYTALLTQNSTSDPVVTELINQLGDVLTINRQSTGVYRATFTTPVPQLKTVIKIYGTMYAGCLITATVHYTAGKIDYFDIYTSGTGTPATPSDGALINTPLEIQLFN